MKVFILIFASNCLNFTADDNSKCQILLVDVRYYKHQNDVSKDHDTEDKSRLQMEMIFKYKSPFKYKYNL